MLVWDDLKGDEKIKIYDRGVEVDSREGIYNMRIDYRSGDMWSPRVEHREALNLEIAYFIQCIERDETPVNDGQAGLRVVRMLEMADDLIATDDIEGACKQLESALGKCDGVSPPADFVTGPAASELHDMILELMAELGCE